MFDIGKVNLLLIFMSTFGSLREFPFSFCKDAIDELTNVSPMKRRKKMKIIHSLY